MEEENKLDLLSLEKVLQNQPFFGGVTPTFKDKRHFDFTKSCHIDAQLHPNLKAWKALVSRFADKVRDNWARSEEELMPIRGKNGF